MPSKYQANAKQMLKRYYANVEKMLNKEKTQDIEKRGKKGQKSLQKAVTIDATVVWLLRQKSNNLHLVLLLNQI